MANAMLVVWGKGIMGKKITQLCYSFKEREGCVRISFAFWRLGQWKKGREETNIQRYRLPVRDTDMFSRAWQKHWKKSR